MKRISIYLMKPKLNYFLIFSFILAHSAANKDINNANFLNATTNTETNYKLISIGSPIAESDLRESTNAVGAELVRQVSHPYDPVRAIGSKKDMWEYGTSMLIASMIGRQGIAKFTPKFHPNIFGFLINPLVVVSYDLYNYHSFKTYYQNPEFQLQQTIQKIFIENAIKESNQKELSNEKN